MRALNTPAREASIDHCREHALQRVEASRLEGDLKNRERERLIR